MGKSPLEQMVERELGSLPPAQLQAWVRELRVRRVPSAETITQRRAARPKAEQTADDIVATLVKKTGLPKEAILAAIQAAKGAK